MVRLRLSVIAPVIVLTALFLILFVIFMYDNGTALDLEVSQVIGGVVVYALVAILTVRLSLINVRRLEDLSLTDSLSNVRNRRALHQDVTQFVRPGDEVALAMIDLDGFKSVNDHFGHFVGDRVIKECAKLLGQICGTNARYYRLGGDEFAIVVMGTIAGNILESICHTLLERLQKPMQIDDRQISLGASIGLSWSNKDENLSSSELLRRSDVAMYVSKDTGKMRCTWFKEEFDQRREENQQLESELRLALERDEFCLHYQPLVNAQTKSIVAVEALVRWERADGRKIGPDVFIPIAEECGLIDLIGLWVLRKACEEALNWQDIKLSVNVSAAQLRNSDFPIQLGHILEETGFPAARLDLEVTETYLVGDPIVAGRSLDMIRHFGVGIVLDDFGTGYASIGFLRKFRFEKLKLDRSMIVDSSLDDGSRAILVSSIAVARAMNMDVTAEGVETEAQAELVRAAGCDQIQGWLYFKAVPANELDRLLLAEDARADQPNINHIVSNR